MYIICHVRLLMIIMYIICHYVYYMPCPFTDWGDEVSRADSDEISARPDSAQPAWASLGSWTSAGHKILLCKVLLTFHFIRFHFIRFHLIRFHLIRFNFMKIFFVNSFYSNITTTRDRRNICTSDLKDMSLRSLVQIFRRSLSLRSL